MSNLVTRIITGTVFVIVMVGGILWNIWSYLALFVVIALAGLWEFYTLLDTKEKGVQKLPGMMLGVILIGASCGKYFFEVNTSPPLPGIQFLILIFPLFLIFKLFTDHRPLSLFSPTLFGILYTVLPFCYLIIAYSSMDWTSTLNNSRIILGFFILIWSNDTFAYVVGRSLGKTKLFERISPKKTWEGTVGGAVLSQLTAWILSIYFTSLEPIHWHVIALIVSVFGTLGDLVESMFKRSLGVKDSGNILPGHGGILDRFDAVLIAAPFVVSYLILVD